MTFKSVPVEGWEIAQPFSILSLPFRQFEIDLELGSTDCSPHHGTRLVQV